VPPPPPAVGANPTHDPDTAVAACVGGDSLPLNLLTEALSISREEIRTLSQSFVLLVAADDGRLPGAAATEPPSTPGGAPGTSGELPPNSAPAEHQGRPVALLNPSPYQLVAASPLAQVHVLFAMLGLSHVYVTDCGELIGEISRESLMRKLDTLVELD